MLCICTLPFYAKLKKLQNIATKSVAQSARGEFFQRTTTFLQRVMESESLSERCGMTQGSCVGPIDEK